MGKRETGRSFFSYINEYYIPFFPVLNSCIFYTNFSFTLIFLLYKEASVQRKLTSWCTFYEHKINILDMSNIKEAYD